MSAIQLEIPVEILDHLNETPDTMTRELPWLAAAKLFELGKLSSGQAARMAGVSRVEFLARIGRYQVSPFTMEAAEFLRDVERA